MAAVGAKVATVNTWLTRSELDRVEQHRESAEWTAGLWRDEHARLLKVTEAGDIFTDSDSKAMRCSRPFVEYDPERHYLLGLVDGRPYFAVQALADGPVAPLRTVAPQLGDLEAEIAFTAVALINWHRTAKFCGFCGSTTTVTNGGFARRCTGCDRMIFPRTDPAVIVAIVDSENRILLGHQGAWDQGRMSVFAGFVEAGESLEQAVHREMAEETDLDLDEIVYLGSQPWPMPRSLMVGFAARAASTDVSVDGDEIESAKWFTPQTLLEEVKSGRVTLPGKASIAHRMILQWSRGELKLPRKF